MTRTGNGAALTLLVGAGALAWIVRDHLSTPFDPIFDSAGSQFGVDPNLLRAIARRENARFDPKARNLNRTPDPGDDDLGLMQINVRTARAMGVTDLNRLFDPGFSARLAAEFLVRLRAELKAKAGYHTIIAAYNLGSPKVIKFGILNPLYVGEVVYHHQLYSLGRMLR